MFWMFLAVGAGAAIGAWLRWGLSWWLNPAAGAAATALPLGTLAANLAGGFAVGLALVWLAPLGHQAWRLFLVTGLLGALTTFSTFSGEVVAMLQHGRWALALGTSAAHLLGSLLMTGLGVWVAQSASR
jgi:fluoride exporter